jgi:hypothetical protein
MRHDGHRRARAFILTTTFTAVLSFATLYTGLATGDDSDPDVQAPTLTAEERAELFRPGDVWAGRGVQGLSELDAASFDEYPVFWLGPSFAGYNLHVILREQYDPETPALAYEAMNAVGLATGNVSSRKAPRRVLHQFWSRRSRSA